MCDSNANNLVIVENNNEKSSLNSEEPKTIDENLNEINSIIKPTKQRTWVKCDLCNVPLSSKNSIHRHIIGKRHIANMKKITGAQSQLNKKLYCEICKIKTNGDKQLEDHLKSNKHQGRLDLLERRKQLKNNCFFTILVGSFIFAVIVNILYFMFTYVKPL